MGNLSLGAALRRGALVTAANWPVVVIDFVLELFYKLALTFPIFGGALMVVALIGGDLGTVVGEGLRATTDLVIGSLGTAPVALWSFLLALAIVGVGGEALMFLLKAGTLSVLVAGERAAAEGHVPPQHAETLRHAQAYSLNAVYEGTRRFGRRAFTLALWLAFAYAVVGGAYLLAMGYGFALVAQWPWMPAWPLLVLMATTTAVVSVAGVNLAFDLMRVIVLTDDCGVRVALRRLWPFVVDDARQVVGIFSVIGGIQIVMTAVSLLAAGGIALVAWVPVVGLVVVPLQIAAWLFRGVLLQYVALTALSAYQTQYRRYSDLRFPVAAPAAATSEM